MSASIKAFFALDRPTMHNLLLKAVEEMNDQTMRNAVYLVLSAYKPSVLQALADTHTPAEPVAKPSEPSEPAEPVAKPAAKPVVEEPENLSSDNEAHIKWVMKNARVNYQDAWTYIRCKELEDGASICCSEECEGNDSAIDELVWAAETGKKKRNSRRLAAGRPVSPENSDDE